MDSAARRRQVTVAGHTGDRGTAVSGLHDPDPAVRGAALGALQRMAGLDAATLQHALTDADVGVRRRAAELAGTNPEVDLIPMLADPDSSVVEAAAWACGEQGQAASVAALGDLAGTHDDPLCREAAVASLGAIGDFAGLPAILAALDDRATVRRRAVIALAPFNGETVDVALQTALEDRDWQVRQAAEELSEYRSP